MNRNLPPLSAVRVFEAAARHESFTAAAVELHVTQSAVSHQVRRLEEHFGRPLFRRAPTGLTLTAAGRAYQHELTDLLNRLDTSSRRVTHPDPTEVLRIKATPAFTRRWLLPRLADFALRHFDIDYDVAVGFPPTDFSGDDVDIYIHWGTDPVDGACVEPFLETARTPVASPAFLRAAPPIRRPVDLCKVTLLHDKVADGWSEWFYTCGIEPPPVQGPRFAHCELAITAAETGQGVDLGYLALIKRELNDGRLVRLFDQETPSRVIYSLAYRKHAAQEPRIKAFRDWIFEQVDANPVPLQLVAGS
jgi:LysR family glycine cleavage system transcriptional activator